MLKHQDPIPTLTAELVVDPFEDYPEEVLESEWNPVLTQVSRLRQQRRKPAKPQLLYANRAKST
jgi:hypothetical protein